MPFSSDNYWQFLLCFLEKLSFTNYPTSRIVNKGATTEFACNATGFPVPSFEWRRDQLVITNREDISYSSGGKVLKIFGVTENDTGNYTCIISNVHGSMTSSMAILTVQCMYVPCLSLILIFPLIAPWSQPL